MQDMQSICCGAPLVADAQCEACGADGRVPSSTTDAELLRFYRGPNGLTLRFRVVDPTDPDYAEFHFQSDHALFKLLERHHGLD